MHPDAGFVIIAFSALAVAVIVIVMFLRRYARAGSKPEAASTSERTPEAAEGDRARVEP
jgi:hypothetical protein